MEEISSSSTTLSQMAEELRDLIKNSRSTNKIKWFSQGEPLFFYRGHLVQ
ncbi:hypothetical protein ACEQPO_23390 [Bacillus sp. SL00103]